jgi:hypothetical protein
MQHWYDQAKRKIHDIRETIAKKYPEAVLKMAFVGYRDFTPHTGTSVYEGIRCSELIRLF